MNRFLPKARSVKCLVSVSALLLFFGLELAAAGTVKGIYVGSDFYAPDESTQNAARVSGFTRLFLSFFHVDERGDITYNGTPIVRNGLYVGDPTWSEKLARIRKQPSGINRIELAIGGGPRLGMGAEDSSFANIKNLISSQGTGPASVLYRDFVALKAATGGEAVQIADENTYDASSVAALGKMIAGLGLKVTFCTYTNKDFWVNAKSQLDTNVDAIYLVCFGAGASNDPAAWIPSFAGTPVYPGLWGNLDTSTSAMMKMRNWRASDITGGFMWLNGSMPGDAERWSGALSYGLDPIASLRIVNKNSGKSLNLANGAMTNGSPINQLAYEADNNQRWMLVPTGKGDHFKIVSWVNGRCGSIAFDSSMVGARLWTWDYNNDPSQQFDLIDAGNGWFEIKNVRSGLVLEVAGGSTTDEAVVQQNTRTGAANQMWKVFPSEATLLAFENFDYPVGNLGGQSGGEGWNGDWVEVVSLSTKVLPGNLLADTNAPAEYDARSSGNSAFIPNDQRVGRYLDCSVSGNFGVYGYLDSRGNIGADDKTLYISFLSQPAKTGLFYEFELNRGMDRIAGIGNDTHTGNVNLRAPANVFTPISEGSTNVSLYVMRIDFQSGKDDVRVYRNPTSETEPDEPTLSLFDAADLSFNRVSLAAFANANTVRFDQIRIASSWKYAVAAAPEFSIQPSSNIVADDIFRRVRISAQVLGGGADKYYLIDGDTGLRISLNRPTQFEPGDVVTLTGLVKKKNQLVELIEAEARKTNHLPLPQPRPLDRLNSNHQNLWVSFEGTLTGLRQTGAEREMQIQNGFRKVLGRMRSANDKPLNWQIGSRLKLTGVCLHPTDSQAVQDNSEPFELLVNSAADVEILARPPWWTLKRAMVAMGMLAAGLALAFMWIRSLQRQVTRQTARLMSEITQREQAERARVIEEERSRISRDLHDDLGSILTQINMLATSGLKLSPDLMRERTRQISEKSHRMISALDEVVWMMNSRNEPLSSLAAYVAAHTEEFLSKTNIVCRIEAPPSYPEKAVAAEVRNNVFSCVKEAINNSVRHGKPNKISLKLTVLGDTFEISLEDDGCGFDPLKVQHGNGLSNLQMRMQKVGGSCQIHSSPGSGTIVILRLPLILASQ